MEKENHHSRTQVGLEEAGLCGKDIVFEQPQSQARAIMVPKGEVWLEKDFLSWMPFYTFY